MIWVTWDNVGIDRLASAWLIEKYIDVNAQFTFIPFGTYEYAENEIPFDIPGVKFSHKKGHCTFHCLITKYKIDDPVINKMAKIIDGADTLPDLAISEESQGVDAICTGLRFLLKDDYDTIEKSKIIFDSLYEYLKNNIEKRETE